MSWQPMPKLKVPFTAPSKVRALPFHLQHHVLDLGRCLQLCLQHEASAEEA